MSDNPHDQPLPATSEPSTPAKHPFWKKGWFIGVVALVLGIILGSAAAGGTEEAPAAGGIEEAAAVPTATATVEVEVEVEGDPPPAETVTVDPAPDVQAGLDALAAELDERSAALDAREAAITGQENAIAAGTFPGDGVFIVGTDVQPGTYRAESSGRSCYWARLSAPGEIIDNGLGDGQQVAEIQAGDALFETSGCTEWTVVP